MKKPDIPDLSTLKEKLKIDKILNSIADVVDGTTPLTDVDPDDAIANKIADLDKEVCQLLKAHKQNTEHLSKLHTLLNGLYEDVNRLRKDTQSKSATQKQPKTPSEPVSKTAATDPAPEVDDEKKAE